MKKILFITATILYSISCLGQQKIALNNIININIPDHSQKITKDQALSHSKEKFRNDKIVTDDIARNSSAYIYKVDDIIVSLYPHNKKLNLKQGYLISLKKGFDEMDYGDTSYKSSLIKVNSNSVLILRNGYNNTASYNFYCYNAANTHSIAGRIQFNRTDEKEANAILDELLNSIDFKE